jgi:predicted RNA binding protein YcfA (HicA-like mRNA interferase family)
VKLPRDRSGVELSDPSCSHWDYASVHQVGSHIILETLKPFPHRVSVPAHKVLRIGTLNGIVRSVAAHKGVSRDQILRGL